MKRSCPGTGGILGGMGEEVSPWEGSPAGGVGGRGAAGKLHREQDGVPGRGRFPASAAGSAWSGRGRRSTRWPKSPHWPGGVDAGWERQGQRKTGLSPPRAACLGTMHGARRSGNVAAGGDNGTGQTPPDTQGDAAVDEPALHKTFSEIQTIWTKVHDAAAGAPDAAAQARSELLVRYHEAVFRYLLKKLRD